MNFHIKRKLPLVWAVLAVALLAAVSQTLPAAASPVLPQAATQLPPLPTVTGTPTGVIVTVTNEYEQINVRSGPGQLYAKVGVLLSGQQVPAKGRSPKGEWILIDYPGIPTGQAWVYSYLVTYPTGSFLPVVEPPPEPTPLATATIDPTLAAQFQITTAPTRLPTFTPPPPLVVPTLPADMPATGLQAGVPPAMLILGLGTLGVFLMVVSLIRGR